MTARAGIHPARNRSARAIIGAGTDLGKSILIYGQGLDLYSLHPSEGDHADFPATTRWEMDLIDSIQARDQ